MLEDTVGLLGLPTFSCFLHAGAPIATTAKRSIYFNLFLIMSRNKLKYILLLAVVAMGAPACKKQLNVGNPNNPTVSSNITTETSLYAYAQGAVYVNGFKNGDAWLGDSY